MALHACVPAGQSAVSRAIPTAESTLPPIKIFKTGDHRGPIRSNADLARDFMELTFQLESGRKLSYFSRFEGPITVAVTGKPPATLAPDLKRLLLRLRKEAGIDIRQTTGSAANITIHAVTRAQIRSVLPQAACFVAPNVRSISEYRKLRRRPQTDWTLLKRRQKLAIFLPGDVSPQEARDCLHEELGQALGPLNDLYRLSDSVFNDDNVHTVLTSYDMTILRAYYAPEIRSGMVPQQVAAALPGIFARVNPEGQGMGRSADMPTPKAWKDAIQGALGNKGSARQRRASAATAVRIARQNGWSDQRRAFAHYAMGRVIQASDPATARKHYREAQRFYGKSAGSTIHRAFVDTQLAAHALSDGDPQTALRLVSPHIDNAHRAENAALLATLLMLRAEALDMTGRSKEARAVRLDSMGWARYGFGPDWVVRAKLREIAALNPRKG